MPKPSAVKERITITIDPDQLARWKAVAALERSSLSHTMTGWLEQVIEAAEFVGGLADSQRGQGVESVRAMIAALQVAQEQALSTVLAARGGSAGSEPSLRGARPAGLPPSCNTGGKFKPQRAPRGSQQ